MSKTDAPLLSVRDLRKYFVQRSGPFMGFNLGKQHKHYLHALDNVSFDIARGETLGLVGESGCGKSTLGKTLLRLYEPDAGEIFFSGNGFEGKNICALPKDEMRALRRRMQMVFQDPYDSLNSRHSVGDIVEEPLLVHGIGTPLERREKVKYLLQQVGLPANASERYPHEFSGGQRQRIGIARAIALQPDFIVCDEPLSALDVSVQAQIINLLLSLREQMNLSLLFISHDLSVVRHIADRVAVMYLGEIVEIADANSIYHNARHPYTRYLIASVPKYSEGHKLEPRTQKLISLPDDIPSPLNPPSGCRFHPRCPEAQDICRTQPPELKIIASDGHRAACHFA